MAGFDNDSNNNPWPKILTASTIPKILRRTDMVAIPKLSKDQTLAASCRPVIILNML